VRNPGCTLDGYKILKFVKDRGSVIFGVWAAKRWGAKPPTVWKGLPGPRAAQTPKMSDFRPL
jgi:hypothetical protein